MSTVNTAILFFSRTQQDEFSAKSLGVNRNRFGSLYKFFTSKTLNTARDTGLPVIESYSDQQQGRTFNERLINELQLVTRQGFENVIIIGNDAPGLSREDILLAYDQLSKGRHVLGKDNRGGAYLIGLNLLDFEFSTFNQVKWNSSSVHDQLREQLNEVYELSPKTDINHLQDIRSLIKKTSALTRGAIRFLRTFLSSDDRIITHLNLIESSEVSLTTYRGPPVLSF